MIVATNGFTRDLIRQLKVFPARNQVLVTAPIEGLKVKGTFHYDKGYYYFRNIDNRILLGGGRNLAFGKERTVEFGTTPLIRAALTKILKRHILPGQKVKSRTGGVASWESGNLKNQSLRKSNPTSL